MRLSTEQMKEGLKGAWFYYQPSSHGTVRRWGLSSFIAQDEQAYSNYICRNRIEDEAVKAGLQALRLVELGDALSAGEQARLAAGWAAMAVRMTEMYQYLDLC